MSDKPKQMRYDSQAILVLAADLSPDAKDLQQKREQAGDTQNAFDFSQTKSRIFELAQITTLPPEYRQATSRLYILAHGNSKSTIIASAQEGGITWSPEQLYTTLKAWMSTPGKLPTRVQRISLLVCYAGGNRGVTPIKGSGSNQSGFTVGPEDSFAYNFACMAGSLTADVTARTHEARGVRTTSNGTFVTAYQTVGGRHHGEGDKFIFTTVAGSTPKDPKPASITATWKEPKKGAA
jgi:hypothetical protein